MNELDSVKTKLNISANCLSREDYECPECGRDAGEQGRHAFDDVTVLWYFTCEHCGIDFGGDL
jgi:ribosomal protein L37AE/L43A